MSASVLDDRVSSSYRRSGSCPCSSVRVRCVPCVAAYEPALDPEIPTRRCSSPCSSCMVAQSSSLRDPRWRGPSSAIRGHGDAQQIDGREERHRGSEPERGGIAPGDRHCRREQQRSDTDRRVHVRRARRRSRGRPARTAPREGLIYSLEVSENPCRALESTITQLISRSPKCFKQGRWSFSEVPWACDHYQAD